MKVFGHSKPIRAPSHDGRCLFRVAFGFLRSEQRDAELQPLVSILSTCPISQRRGSGELSEVLLRNIQKCISLFLISNMFQDMGKSAGPRHKRLSLFNLPSSFCRPPPHSCWVTRVPSLPPQCLFSSSELPQSKWPLCVRWYSYSFSFFQLA